jgi:plastocyanin
MLASAYNPTTLTVNKNSIVAFINNSGAGHTVTFDDRPDGVTDIPLHTSGTNNRTFTQVGKFKFHCTQHGGMSGEITVN